MFQHLFLTWESRLKITGIELELFTDQTMYEMCEIGIRGGISSVMGSKYKWSCNKTNNPDFDYFKEFDKREYDRAIVNSKVGKDLTKDLLILHRCK